jgi:hypothetical protein
MMTTTAVDIQWQLDKVLEHGWCVEGGEGRRREARWGYEDVTAVVLSCGQSLDIPVLDESRHDSRCLIQSKGPPASCFEASSSCFSSCHHRRLSQSPSLTFRLEQAQDVVLANCVSPLVDVVLFWAAVL